MYSITDRATEQQSWTGMIDNILFKVFWKKIGFKTFLLFGIPRMIFAFEQGKI